VQRGVNRQPCFFAARDYADYLRLLRVCADEYGCRVHAYCLMTNHVHLLVTPQKQDSCARLMKQLNQCYVQGLNKAAGRSGTLWAGRFHSSIVATERYILACYRYIELNPVRAGLVAHARDYRWSSYFANAEGEADPIVREHQVYRALNESAHTRRHAYRALLDAGVGEAEVQAIRKATSGGYRVGDERRGRGRQPRRVQPQPELVGLEQASK
jgi:putative transposase